MEDQKGPSHGTLFIPFCELNLKLYGGRILLDFLSGTASDEEIQSNVGAKGFGLIFRYIS